MLQLAVAASNYLVAVVSFQDDLSEAERVASYFIEKLVPVTKPEVEKEEERLELFFGLDKNDLLRMAEVLVLSIVAILVILLVIRPLVSRAFESIPAAAAAGERMLSEQAAAAAALMAPGVSADAGVEEEQFEELIDIDRVEGRVKASSVKKVGEIVEKHPDEALSIIRSWMYQEG